LSNNKHGFGKMIWEENQECY
jgi:hypothetical protein